ncbi:two pore domain potassium channel family protein [Priestia filamentosa]|uniref:ion channel n=1 Tax=Priestia filamentosa TaxID=1402861 RepID=UPI001FB346EF|nr:ion channel [Priestia filamentosa]UOE59807.1 two pore domain potassium channel family protein [Priestia filamentosa]
MIRKLFMKQEFNRKKLWLYFILDIVALALLILNSFIKVPSGFWGTSLLIFFLLLLGLCLFLLAEFVILIPKTNESLPSIFTGSALVISLMIITYADIYLQIYHLKGGQTFSGTYLTGEDFLYYSITTFTTTGYGDVSSSHIVSNAVASLEMMTGFMSNTLLMGILTAKLVNKGIKVKGDDRSKE